jgi:hypothetical protein
MHIKATADGDAAGLSHSRLHSLLPVPCTGSTLSAAAPASVATAAREASAAGGAADAAGGPGEATPTKAYDPSGDGGRPTGESPRAPTSDSDDGTETMHR